MAPRPVPYTVLVGARPPGTRVPATAARQPMASARPVARSYKESVRARATTQPDRIQKGCILPVLGYTAPSFCQSHLAGSSQNLQIRDQTQPVLLTRKRPALPSNSCHASLLSKIRFHNRSYSICAAIRSTASASSLAYMICGRLTTISKVRGFLLSSRW